MSVFELTILENKIKKLTDLITETEDFLLKRIEMLEWRVMDLEISNDKKDE